MYMAMFVAFAVILQYGRSGYILAHISEPTGDRNFKFKISGSKVVIGNGGLNSKSVISMVLSWKVTIKHALKIKNDTLLHVVCPIWTFILDRIIL